MNTDLPREASSIYVEVLIDEKWIDKIVEEYQIEIPVNEKITLSNIRVQIGEDILNIVADLTDNTSINVTAKPVWDAANQIILISDLKLKTDTKNVLLKSASIFAQVFLNSKIDKKLEEQANRMFKKQVDKLKSKPVDLPVPKGGIAHVQISSITIQSLDFLDQAIRVKATIEGTLNVHLNVEKT